MGMTDEQKLYFGTAAQRAAMKKKHPSWKNGRKSAANNKSKTKKTTSRKTTSKKTTSRKTTKKTTKKTVTTGQAVGIGLGSAAVGAVGGFAAGTLLSDQTQALLANMANSNNSLLAAVGSIGGKLLGTPAVQPVTQIANNVPVQNGATAFIGPPVVPVKVDSAAASYAAYQAAVAAGQPVMTTAMGGIISTNQGDMRTAADKAFDALYT